jgi:hypothetical protein
VVRDRAQICSASSTLWWSSVPRCSTYARDKPTLIVAFEPSPKSIDVLRSRCARSPNVDLEQRAMGDAPGQAQVHLALKHR